MRLLLRWAINAIAIWAAIQLVPGIEHTGSTLSLILIALVFGLVNALVRPFLKLLTCPLIILTLGLFILVVNALMLWLTGLLMPALTIDGFGPAFLGAIIISVVSSLLSIFIQDDKEKKRKRD
jgi:putative membrane protein